MQRRPSGTIVLKRIEGRPALFIEKCGAPHFWINGEQMEMCRRSVLQLHTPAIGIDSLHIID